MMSPVDTANRSGDSQGNDALLLDMGEFMLRPPIGHLPEIIASKEYNLISNVIRSSASDRNSRITPEPSKGSVASEDRNQGTDGDAEGSQHTSRSLGALWRPAQAAVKSPAGIRHFKLFQVISPGLAQRGRVFGTKLALKDEWFSVDESFFAAPGWCRKEVVSTHVYLAS